MDIPFIFGDIDEVTEMTTRVVTINNLSFLVLGKVHFNAAGLRIYGLVGPRFDAAISKSISLQASDSTQSLFNPYLQSALKPYKDSQFGITMGAGVQSDNILPCGIGAEIRFSPDFTHTMDIPILHSTKSQSWEFLMVLTF
jgi:hypothetical protein